MPCGRSSKQTSIKTLSTSLKFTKDTPTSIKIKAKNNKKQSIKFKTVHISCQSDQLESGNNYVGIVLYDLGTLKTKLRWKPAYVYIKKSKEVEGKWESTDEGKVHGTLCRMLLGCQPSKIAEAGGCIGGFSIEERNDKTSGFLKRETLGRIGATDFYIKGTSGACNTKGIYALDIMRESNECDIWMLQNAFQSLIYKQERTSSLFDYDKSIAPKN